MDRTQLAQFWHGQDNLILLNNRMESDRAQSLKQLAQDVSDAWRLKGHIFISTSGSNSDGSRLVALSQAALLNSAKAVNDFLQVNKNDVWAQALPLFHVGGLGIEARAHLSGAKVIETSLKEQKWDMRDFYQILQQRGVTLTALVPAQVYDLVEAGLPAPEALRAIVVGGAELSTELYQRGRQLGWPLLPSYGMTEACSQVATAPLTSLQDSNYPDLQLLSHIKAEVSESGRLRIQANSLLTLYAMKTKDGQLRVWDPKIVDGWFETEDLVEIRGQKIKILGRDQDFIKIGGEATNLSRLRRQLAEVTARLKLSVDEYALLDLPSERLGKEIYLITESSVAENIAHVCEGYNQSVLPFEKIRGVHNLKEIPRSELGKIKWSELRRSLK